MLFLTLPAKNFEFLQEKIKKYDQQVDGFEIRWDFASKLFPSEIRAISNKPFIFTLRTKKQGGIAEKVSFHQIQLLAKANPEYLDLESDFPVSWFKEIKENFPNIQLIGSYHDFKAPPKVIPEMPYADIIKIAAFCENSLDGLHLLNRRYDISKPFILIGMGKYGQFTRLMGRALGSLISYATDENEPLAPGQMSIEEMNDIYHYSRITTSTRFYALLGKPVDYSMGHLFHNLYFREYHQNACYLKIEIAIDELNTWLTESLNFPFQGFSLTTPLKIIAHQIMGSKDDLPSVNTLLRVNHHWRAFNTDAEGAWNALGQFKPTRVMILGAGGVGLALNKYFENKKLQVFLYSRTPKESVILFDDVENFPEVELIVNTIPNIPKKILKKLKQNITDKTRFLDFVYPQSSFTVWVQQHKGHLISGKEVFIQQALLQQKIWN